MKKSINFYSLLSYRNEHSGILIRIFLSKTNLKQKFDDCRLLVPEQNFCLKFQTKFLIEFDSNKDKDPTGQSQKVDPISHVFLIMPLLL